MFDDGSLSKLKVCELDKYLGHYKMRNTYRLKKKDKVRMIQRHIAMTTNGLQENDVEAVIQQEEESDLKSDSSESDSAYDTGGNIVIADTHLSSSSSEESDELNRDFWPDESFDPGSLFTTTRSGRTATTWKAAEYVSVVQLLHNAIK